MPNLKGKHNPSWKGQDAAYRTIHEWVQSEFGRSERCTNCLEYGKTHWANISGEYIRKKQDWIELCVPCHRLLDTASYKKTGKGVSWNRNQNAWHARIRFMGKERHLGWYKNHEDAKIIRTVAENMLFPEEIRKNREELLSRAKGRALRDALNIAQCLKEELLN